MYYLLIAAIVALDQVVKFFIRADMDVNESLPVIDGIFHITYIQNTGAAFSILEGHREILIIFPIVMVAVIILYIAKQRKRESKVLLSALSLIAAGGIGNVFDRFFLGFVTDMFDFRIWPIFNVADISICCGCGLLIIYVFLVEGKQNKKKYE